VLGAGAGVAAELRRVHVLDLQALRLGKREELPGHLQHTLPEPRGDAVAGDVEEPDLMRGGTQVGEERVAIRPAKARDVDDGKSDGR